MSDRCVPRLRPTAVLAWVLAAAILVGCAADDPDPRVAPGAGGRVDPAVFVGEATTIDGARFDLGDLAGKDLVVWFWAPW